MRLMVCPRDGVTHYLDAPVTHFVSLIDPDETATTLQPPHSTERQLRLVFNDLDDIEMNLSNFARYCPPQEDDVVELVEFGKALSPLIDWGLLASCEAGISRSTAAAITILTSAGYRPQTAFGVVRRICPEMLPNRRILRIADHLLNTGGTLYHMAEIHRRKAFLRAGYEDPTNVLLREAQSAKPEARSFLSRLLDIFPVGWRTMGGSGARMRAVRNRAR